MSSLILGALTSGCIAGETDETIEFETVETVEAPLCDNRDGVNAAMTALAVAAGREMGRVLPGRDFTWNNSTGRLETTSYGRGRCPNGSCANVEAVLAMQNAPSNTVTFPGGVVLNPASLRSALKTNWTEFQSCTSRGTCPQQTWDLRYRYWERGSCDVKYFFDVYPQGSSSRITSSTTLQQYYQNLIFVGYPENKMLNFYIRDGQLSIDPTSGLNEGGTTMSGSCTNACTKFSSSSVAGQCCSCNGVTRKFVRSTFSTTMYLCK